MIYQTTQAKFILFAILFFGMSAEMFAADGDLDTTFGNAGIVITDNDFGGDIIGDIAIQPDGKVVAIGTSVMGSTIRTVVVRYNADGSVDSTFGASGKVSMRIKSRNLADRHKFDKMKLLWKSNLSNFTV